MLGMHLSPKALALLVLVVLLLRFLVAYLRNPLRKVPAAHPLAHWTPLWIHYVRWRAVENATLKEAHGRLGPVVCLGPKEVSVNCVQGGIKTIYAGGFEKGGTNGAFNWYGFFANYGGVDNMFSTGANKTHSLRKRMLSNVYSKSVVTASPALLAQMTVIICDRFLPALAATFAEDEPGVLNIYALLSATTMDIVTSYIFGLRSSSNLIQDPKKLDWFLQLYNSRRSFNFWPQELPGLTAFLEKWFRFRLVPRWVDEANEEIERWTSAMCDSASNVLREGGIEAVDAPIVYQQLRNTLKKETTIAESDEVGIGLKIASEVLDHLAAGFDTSGITLTYVIHELCCNPDIQQRLQNELRGLSPRITALSPQGLPDPKAVDALPLLHAVIWETLRLHSAIPGPQPRVTPAQGCRVGLDGKSYFVPGGVRVSASAGLLHRNEDVYQNAGEWLPDRWLDMDKMGEEKRKDMESRWFWAFGSGGRMCVGSHLAVYQMKFIIAALYSSYSTIAVDDAGIEQLDAYTAPPSSDKFVIKLQKLAI